MCCPSLLSNLSDSPEARDNYKNVVKSFSTRFNRADRLVLYPIALALIIDVLVILYQVTEFTPTM
jgi:hypothetical protein